MARRSKFRTKCCNIGNSAIPPTSADRKGGCAGRGRTEGQSCVWFICNTSFGYLRVGETPHALNDSGSRCLRFLSRYLPSWPFSSSAFAGDRRAEPARIRRPRTSRTLAGPAIRSASPSASGSRRWRTTSACRRSRSLASADAWPGPARNSCTSRTGAASMTREQRRQHPAAVPERSERRHGRLPRRWAASASRSTSRRSSPVWRSSRALRGSTWPAETPGFDILGKHQFLVIWMRSQAPVIREVANTDFPSIDLGDPTGNGIFNPLCKNGTRSDQRRGQRSRSGTTSPASIRQLVNLPARLGSSWPEVRRRRLRRRWRSRPVAARCVGTSTTISTTGVEPRG